MRTSPKCGEVAQSAGGDVKQVQVENELKRYKRRVRQIAHMRLIDKICPGKMRKTIVRQALPPGTPAEPVRGR